MKTYFISGAVAVLTTFFAQASEANAIKWSELPRKVLSLHRANPNCSRDLEKAGAGFEPQRFEVKTQTVTGTLFLVPCASYAYQSSDQAFWQDQYTVNQVSVVESADGEGFTSTTELLNASFDPAKLQLATANRSRQLGDCGDTSASSLNEYGAFVLDELTFKACSDEEDPDSNWPVVYKRKK